MQIGANLSRIVADPGYRGHNAPPDHKFKVYIFGSERPRHRETIKRELRLLLGGRTGHRPCQDRAPHGPNYLAGTHGDAPNAVLAAAGYNFRRLLEWLAAFWRVFVMAILANAWDAQIPAQDCP